jgi:hypothetical protein
MGLLKKTPVPRAADEDRAVPRDVSGLLESLEASDASERRWAARDLAGRASASAALVQRLKVEEDVSVRAVILTSLTRTADPTAVTGLVACLRTEDANLRNEAIEAMQALPGQVAPIMQGLLADADPDVRIFAVNVLESLRHPQVEGWLIGVIERDECVNVCGTALDLLVEVGTAAAREPLERLKARFAAEPYIQFAADLALQRLEPC